MEEHLRQLAGTVDVKAEQTSRVLPLLVCLIFGLSMAVIARPRALLSACSCTSKAPHPCVSLCLAASLPLSPFFFFLLFFFSLTFCSAAGGSGVGCAGEGRRMERERGVVKERQEEGGGTTPLFFFLSPLCTRPVPSTPPCYIIHNGTSALGLMEEEVFGVGLPPPERGPRRRLVLSVVFCNECFFIKICMFVKERRGGVHLAGVSSFCM